MKKAIGIVRVSRVNGREGESFASPGEQLERLTAACERDGLQLLRVEEELDVSGGTPLARRTGLRSAVEAIEAGEAQVIVAAYFDRLVRSLKVQHEVVQRVEAAGGGVIALDVGAVTEGTAGQWLSGTLLGAVSEYQRRTTAERSREAQVRAVARGVPPLANIPPGYRRGKDGRLVVQRREAPIVAEAFRMRAEGATIREVQAHLVSHGVARTFRSTQSLLASPIVLGEIHFGAMVNASAHEAIVDADTFRRVQRMIVSRGRKPVSDRLLARQGVLRCGTCDSRLVVGSRSPGRYPMYRCSPTSECPLRVAVSAEIVEKFVVEKVQAALANVVGRASAEAHVAEAEDALSEAQGALDSAIRSLADFAGESAARDTLVQLRQARDDAQAHLDQVGGHAPRALTVSAQDWPSLTLDERRALIRATVKRVSVAPGRAGSGVRGSTDRLTVELFTK